MATAKQSSFDATKPFYAWVGVGDLALARVREVAGDVTSQLAGQVEEVRSQLLGAARSTRGAAEQAQARVLEQVTGRLDELERVIRDAQTRT